MNAYIKTLQNSKKSEIIYPVTKAGAVYMDDNSATVQDVLQDIASKEYVDKAINDIPTPDVSGQIATHNTDPNSHEDIRQAIETAETEVNNLLNGKVNTSELDNYYTKPEVEVFHDEIKNYVDDEVAALVNSAPETLDTLGELAAAFEENKEVVEALDASITNKQDKIADTLILVDTVTGKQHKIQIQNGQLVSFPVE